MYLRFFANHFGYRAVAMSGRQEPISRHRHDPALEKYKKTRQDLHPRFSQQEQGSSRRPSRATRGAPQYKVSGDGDSSPSSGDETEDYRLKHMKRKSTDRDSDRELDDGDSSEEIEEEQQAPLVHHLGQGMDYGLLEVHAPVLPNYVVRVNYKGKGMTM